MGVPARMSQSHGDWVAPGRCRGYRLSEALPCNPRQDTRQTVLQMSMPALEAYERVCSEQNSNGDKQQQETPYFHSAHTRNVPLSDARAKLLQLSNTFHARTVYLLCVLGVSLNSTDCALGLFLVSLLI